MKKSELKKLIKEAINSRGIEPLGYYTDQGEKTEENPEDIEYYLKQIEGMSLDDATRFLGLEGLPSSMTYKILKRHNTDVIDTFDDFSDTENPFQSSRKNVGQLNPDDLYENKIKNLSLDQKAKLYFMGMVKAGLIDTLPENPKAAFVQQMMDSELEKLLDKEEDPRTKSGMEDDENSLKEMSKELGYLNENEPTVFDDESMENFTNSEVNELLDIISKYVEDPDDAQAELDRFDQGGFDAMSDMVTTNLLRDPEYKAWYNKLHSIK